MELSQSARAASPSRLHFPTGFSLALHVEDPLLTVSSLPSSGSHVTLPSSHQTFRATSTIPSSGIPIFTTE